MRILVILAALAWGASGQISPSRPVRFVNADPAGSCSGNSLQFNQALGKLWGCNGGTWTQIGAGGSTSPGGGDTAIQVNHPNGTFAGDETKLSRDDTYGLFSDFSSLGVKTSYPLGAGQASCGTKSILCVFGDELNGPQLGLIGAGNVPNISTYIANGTPAARTTIAINDQLRIDRVVARSLNNHDDRIITVTDDVCGAVGNDIIPTRRTFTLEDLDGSDNDLLVLNGCGQQVGIARISTYDGIATVDKGVPSELAKIDLTAQTAAKSATALYTPIATGMFRVSYYAKVTTAAQVSSILGGTTGLVIAFTDGVDSVAQSLTLPEDNEAGSALSVGSGNTGNATTSIIHGTAVMWAKTGVGMTYAFGYSSTGSPAMAYELHIKVEAL